jgi:Adenylylsulfate kinase and related kinases
MHGDMRQMMAMMAQMQGMMQQHREQMGMGMQCPMMAAPQPAGEIGTLTEIAPRTHTRGTCEREMSWAVWISGPPASGTTAVARATAELLQARGEPVRVLELDTILPRLIPDPKNTEGERDLVHRALGYMAGRLTEAGIPVIVDATRTAGGGESLRGQPSGALRRFSSREDPGRRCPPSTCPMSRRSPRSS